MSYVVTCRICADELSGVAKTGVIQREQIEPDASMPQPRFGRPRFTSGGGDATFRPRPLSLASWERVAA